MQDKRIAILPKLPFRSGDYEFSLRRPAPKLGRQTREVLAEAGLKDTEIEALIASIVVHQGGPGE